MSEQHDGGEFYLGVLDALMALGVALSNRGLVTRQEISDAMGVAIQQQHQQGCGGSRCLAAETLRQIFELPVMPGGRGAAGLIPINGGKADQQ